VIPKNHVGNFFDKHFAAFCDLVGSISCRNDFVKEKITELLGELSKKIFVLENVL
jgi:hypothetical protein